MATPSIEQYLLSPCLFIIHELNEKYRACSYADLLGVALDRFSEADLVVRIAYPFKQMARFVMQGTNIGHDIMVDETKDVDFQIEVKFLKPQRKAKKGGGFTILGATWNPVKKDFDWLLSELEAEPNHQGKRAFVMGWFKYADEFSDNLQIGTKKNRGENCFIHPKKKEYLPFIYCDPPEDRSIHNSKYNYGRAYESRWVEIEGHLDTMHCIFLGKPKDKFHIAIYY